MPNKKLLATFFILATSQAFAVSFQKPAENEAIIGQIQYTSAGYGDNPVTFAKRYDLGINEIVSANPQATDERFSNTSVVQVPSMHLLPDQPRKGIVVNLPEMRIYYYPDGSDQVFTYPVGIGKIGKTIPIVNTSITAKKENPTWTPPKDIREYNEQKGIVLPKVMPPGPDNPLGPYAIYMGIPTYLFHSTIYPESVGTRASFGCLRMFESDIAEFFPTITAGIPVTIINSPVKVAWQNRELFMEAHQPLEEHNQAYDATLPGVVHKIAVKTKNQPTLVDWQLVSYVANEQDGIPHNVGIKIQ